MSGLGGLVQDFTGLIDEVRVWDYHRSAEQINQANLLQLIPFAMLTKSF